MVKELPHVFQFPCYFPWQRLLFQILAEVFAFCFSGLWFYNKLLPTKTAPQMLDKLSFLDPLSIPKKAVKSDSLIFLLFFP